MSEEAKELEHSTNGKSEALKTFIEQTKLLVSLASAFVLAPTAAVSFFHREAGQPAVQVPWSLFFAAEGTLIVSILAGYMTLASIAGSQHSGDFNVYRKATRVFSLLQLALYLVGVVCFFTLVRFLV